MKKKASLLIALLACTPLFTYAAAEGVKSYLADVRVILNELLLLVVGVALIVFMWGLVKFISKAGNPKEHEAGRNLMVWGTIALFVMGSIGGILFYVGEGLGISSNKAIPLPTFSGSTGGSGTTINSSTNGGGGVNSGAGGNSGSSIPPLGSDPFGCVNPETGVPGPC